MARNKNSDIGRAQTRHISSIFGSSPGVESSVRNKSNEISETLKRGRIKVEMLTTAGVNTSLQTYNDKKDILQRSYSWGEPPGEGTLISSVMAEEAPSCCTHIESKPVKKYIRKCCDIGSITLSRSHQAWDSENDKPAVDKKGNPIIIYGDSFKAPGIYIKETEGVWDWAIRAQGPSSYTFLGLSRQGYYGRDPRTGELLNGIFRPTTAMPILFIANDLGPLSDSLYSMWYSDFKTPNKIIHFDNLDSWYGGVRTPRFGNYWEYAEFVPSSASLGIGRLSLDVTPFYLFVAASQVTPYSEDNPALRERKIFDKQKYPPGANIITPRICKYTWRLESPVSGGSECSTCLKEPIQQQKHVEGVLSNGKKVKKYDESNVHPYPALPQAQFSHSTEAGPATTKNETEYHSPYHTGMPLHNEVNIGLYHGKQKCENLKLDLIIANYWMKEKRIGGASEARFYGDGLRGQGVEFFKSEDHHIFLYYDAQGNCINYNPWLTTYLDAGANQSMTVLWNEQLTVDFFKLFLYPCFYETWLRLDNKNRIDVKCFHFPDHPILTPEDYYPFPYHPSHTLVDAQSIWRNYMDPREWNNPQAYIDSAHLRSNDINGVNHFYRSNQHQDYRHMVNPVKVFNDEREGLPHVFDVKEFITPTPGQLSSTTKAYLQNPVIPSIPFPVNNYIRKSWRFSNFFVEDYPQDDWPSPDNGQLCFYLTPQEFWPGYPGPYKPELDPLGLYTPKVGDAYYIDKKIGVFCPTCWNPYYIQYNAPVPPNGGMFLRLGAGSWANPTPMHESPYIKYPGVFFPGTNHY